MQGIRFPTKCKFPAWTWILGLQLALVLPFIGQPIHIDDSIYVDIGRNVLKTPWHAHDFPYIFEGRTVADMASHSHPPFLGYWIGLLLWLFGDGPLLHVKLHLGFLIFPLLFAGGMYRLARRFTHLPGLATAVAITSPAAVVASHTLMTDYPCLAFSTLGLALYIDGVDQQKPYKTWISGVALAVASFCSYPAVLLAGLCWLYAWLKRATVPAALWSPLIAPAWMGVWLTYSSLHFGRFVLGPTMGHVVEMGGLAAGRLRHKLLAFLIFLGGTLVLPLPLIRVTMAWLRGKAAILWALMSAGLAQFAAAAYAWPDRLTLAAFLTLGGWIIAGIPLSLRTTGPENSAAKWRPDTVFLTVWALVTSAQIILTYTAGMARYLLPLLPPVVLLAFLKSSRTSLASLRRSAVLGLSVGLLLGLTLSAADFEMARIHRDIAQNLARVFAGRRQQTRFGAEWGLRHYMLEQGFRQFLSTGDDFAGGQFIVSPREAIAYAVPQDVASILVPVRHQSWESSIPIRLMNRNAHAGYYSSSWGLLPFAISRGSVEEITVQQVSYLAEKLPEITLEGAGKNDLMIPAPATGGGVDISVPVPSRASIPYDSPLRTRVQFSCIAGPEFDKCPIQVFYRSDGTDSELVLQRVDDAADGDSLYFDLPGPARGTIVLNVINDVTDSDRSPAGHHVTIRNWLMLPSGGAPWF
jgi:hypothetical protein